MPRLRPTGLAPDGDVAQALADHRLGQHGRGRRAVTGDVVGLGGDLLGELGAEVLVRVVQLDLLGDRDAVVGDRGGAPLLVDDDVAAPRAERHLDRVGELVDAALERLARRVVELQGLGHLVAVLLQSLGGAGTGPRGGRRRPGAGAPAGAGAPGASSGMPRSCEPALPSYFSMTASTSRADRTRYSSPPCLTSVPPYLL